MRPTGEFHCDPPRTRRGEDRQPTVAIVFAGSLLRLGRPTALGVVEQVPENQPIGLGQVRIEKCSRIHGQDALIGGLDISLGGRFEVTADLRTFFEFLAGRSGRGARGPTPFSAIISFHLDGAVVFGRLEPGVPRKKCTLREQDR